MQTISEWWMWAGFLIFVAIMLALDIFILGGKKAHRISTKEAFSWVTAWIALALLFNFLLWRYLIHVSGHFIANEKALEFLTGYLIEQSLSVDNMFVFLMIFNYFVVPIEYQRRVLLYGVLGAIVMRLIMILFGTWLIAHFHWILYVFGLFLIITGIKMFLIANQPPNLEQNIILRWMHTHLRVTKNFHGAKFIIRSNNLIFFTPLFFALVLIEISDLIFAIDSIPAIFAVTEDPFIVFTSNIFAIMGLRALYFLLANIADRFYLLKYGLALILVLVGGKMLLAYWFKIPTLITLSLVLMILGGCIVLSIIRGPKDLNPTAKP